MVYGKPQFGPGKLSTGGPREKDAINPWQDYVHDGCSRNISRDLCAIADPLAARVGREVGGSRSAVGEAADEGFCGTPKTASENPFFEFFSEAYGHPGEEALKERGPGSYGDHLPDLDALLDLAAEQLSLGFDSRPGDLPDRGDNPTPSRRRLPPRIEARPKAEEWTDDELLTLPEAAALFWPAGPITTNTLRTAARDEALAITKVAGKFFTTPLAIRRMGLDTPGAPKAPPTGLVAVSAEELFERKLAEAKRLGRQRARPRRAARRPALPSGSGRAGQ